MGLISVANAQALTDELAAVWDRWTGITGNKSDEASPVAGTQQFDMNEALSIITSVGDYQQQADMSQAIYETFTSTNQAKLAGYLKKVTDALDGHMQNRGKSVAASIVSLATFLSYYNGGSGGVKFSSMLCPTFNDLWYALYAQNLPVAGIMSPAVHPAYNSAVSVNGMGSKAIGGSFTAGTDPNVLYSAPLTLLEVTTDFANGSAHPQVTVAGTDDTGITSTTWSVTFGTNDPVQAVSTTITPGVTIGSRQTVAVGAITGIVVGSVLTVNAGLPDQEVIVVEALPATSITAAFRKAHTAGATLTGHTTVALTPSVGSRRCVHVSGITYTVTGTDAGACRVVGGMNRTPI